MGLVKRAEVMRRAVRELASRMRPLEERALALEGGRCGGLPSLVSMDALIQLQASLALVASHLPRLRTACTSSEDGGEEAHSTLSFVRYADSVLDVAFENESDDVSSPMTGGGSVRVGDGVVASLKQVAS